MLHLKRVQYFNDFLRCKVSDEIISYGDYYYEDDEDGFIVKASVYRDLKDKKREDDFDYTMLNEAKSEREYKQRLKQYEKNYLTDTVFDRKIFAKELQ